MTSLFVVLGLRLHLDSLAFGVAHGILRAQHRPINFL